VSLLFMLSLIDPLDLAESAFADGTVATLAQICLFSALCQAVMLGQLSAASGGA
jgi:hypothetical protein